MAVARLDTASSAAATTLTYSISAGSNRLLIVCTGAEISTTTNVTGVTYGDQDMTLVPNSEIDAGTGFSFRGEIWYLLETEIAAASGTTITPTYSSAPGDEMICAASYENVDQTGGATTFPAEAQDSTAAYTPNPITTVDLTEVDGGLIVAMVGAGNASSASWQSDMTEQLDQADASSFMSYADRLSTTNANVTIEGTVASQNRAVALSARIAEAQTTNELAGDAQAAAETSAKATIPIVGDAVVAVASASAAGTQDAVLSAAATAVVSVTGTATQPGAAVEFSGWGHQFD